MCKALITWKNTLLELEKDFNKLKKKELKFIKEFRKLKDLQEDVLSFKMPVHFCTSNNKLFYAGYAGGKEQWRKIKRFVL